MSENLSDGNFNAHYEVSQLLHCLGFNEELASFYAERLDNSTLTPRSLEFKASVSNVLTKITNCVGEASKKEKILAIYSSLKVRDAEKVNRFVHFIGAMIKDDSFLNLVKSPAEGSGNLEASGSIRLEENAAASSTNSRNQKKSEFEKEGIQGHHVRAVDREKNGKVVFEVNPALDPHLRDIALRCLPLAAHFDTVVRFCEKRCEFCYGLVCQALCGAMEEILEEYLGFLCTLEAKSRNTNLILQQITYEINPVLRCLEVLTEICINVDQSDLLGGRILSFLYEKHWAYSGAAQARDLCLFLLEKSAKPLFHHMLEAWLFHGLVNDPCLEFFIVDTYSPEDTSLEDFDFDEKDSWEKRYVLKPDLCPSFLKPVSEEILKCGKYLNVLASCGCRVDVESNYGGKLDYCFEEKAYLYVIQDVCSVAGAEVLKFLKQDCGLLQKFESMKKFFFIEQGDWMLEFMDMAAGELDKSVDDVHPHRIARLLDEAIRTSVASSDPLKDEIQVELLEFSLTSFLNFVLSISGGHDLSLGYRQRAMIEGMDRDMKGIEGFCLSWKPGWPLSLVFNQKSLLQYQIIFRRLLMCKHVEKMLCRSWLERNKDLRKCVLRQRMIALVQNYMYYCTVEILEPNWQEFIGRIHKVGVGRNPLGRLNLICVKFWVDEAVFSDADF